MAAGLRIARRRKLARTIRRLMGGARAMPASAATPDLLGARLADIAAETGMPLRDSDQAELLARLRLDDAIPPDVIALICGTLMPILAHGAHGATGVRR